MLHAGHESHHHNTQVRQHSMSNSFLFQSNIFRPSLSGYGPGRQSVKPEIDIEIENDLNTGSPDRPGQDTDHTAHVSHHQSGDTGDTGDQDMVRICSAAARRGSDTAPHPRSCDQFLLCQASPRSGAWIATVRKCGGGTVFDERINQCNFRDKVPRCNKGESR